MEQKILSKLDLDELEQERVETQLYLEKLGTTKEKEEAENYLGKIEKRIAKLAFNF